MHTVRHINCELNFLENETYAKIFGSLIKARKTEQKYERYYLLNLRQWRGVEQLAQDEIARERERAVAVATHTKKRSTIKFRQLRAESKLCVCARERAFITTNDYCIASPYGM